MPVPATAPNIRCAVLGYSLTEDPRGRAAETIGWVNEQPAPVLSLDTPSGLDVTSGRVADPCVRATATPTLALPKVGLFGAPPVGRLYLADISVPREQYRRMGTDRGHPFEADTIIAIPASE